MSNDALDMAVAKFVKQTGLATAEQVAAALQEQARGSADGTPLSLAQVLVRQGILTAAQREAVEKKAQALLGHTQLQHYKLLKKLGEGGMGAVYLAEDTKLGRRVAVKVLPKKFNDNLELLKRFRREAEAAQTLKHPHIVGAYAFGEDAGWHFYVMEYCDGEPLDALLKRDRVLPIARALEITLQVATGLRYAHDLGFIHRDIKPANIFLTREGRAKVLDLGLSKNIEDAELSFKTVSGAVLGTPHYISPEQAQGEKRIDGRTDIYSLGATLYHLLTGQTPFDGSSVYEILSKQVTAQLPNPQDLREDIPEGVVHVLRRMMAKNRADRYRDCGELVRDLEEVAAGKSPATQVLDPALSAVALVRKKAARRATLRRSTARTPGRGAGLAWAAGAAAAALVAVLLLWGGGRGAASGRPAVPEPREKTAPPARASTAPAVPEDPWKKAVDLLALVDPREDAVVGTWTRGPDGIASDRARGARLQIPYAPPEEYDLRVVFTRREGRLDVNLLLWLGDRACAWQMGAYGDEIFGFSLVAGRPVQENPTTQRRPGGLQNGRRTTALVQVRRGGVRAYVDQQLVAEWADLRSIEPDPAWRLPSRARLGLGSQESATVFHAAHLLEVTGRGTPGRGPTAAVDDAWVAAVALLPAEEQVRRVREKLHERNTAFVPESLQAEIEGGKVVGVSTTNVVLSDIAPLRALRDLRRVSLTGEAENPRRRNRMPLQDLEPLRGMRLTELDVSLTFVSDLSPVQGMPLTRLILGHARVQRLDAVRGMPLVHLECNGTEVEDLSPLRGLKLRQLSIADTEVRDLSPLQGMPLESLAANRSSIESLEPLRGMPLRTLHILGTEGPDLAVLRTLPLRDLMLDLKAGHELGVLLDLADLEVVNTLGAAEFWRRHAPAGSVFHEGEALKVLERSEGSLLERQAMAQTGSGWSGDAQVGIRSPSPLWATLELPVPASGRYRVIVWTTRAPNHGALDLSVDGRPLDRIVLGDVPKAVPVARAVGELDLVGGPRTLRLAVSEKSPDSTLYRGALDAVHLVRLPEGTAPAGRGLVGHWTFDEGRGDQAADASGSGLAAKLVNGPRWVVGQRGGGLRFDGNDEYAELPSHPVLDRLQDKSFTVAAWYKPLALPRPDDPRDGEHAIFLKQGFHTGLDVDAQGRFKIQTWFAGDRSSGVFSARRFVPGRFHHVAGVLDRRSGRIDLYVDGKLEGSASFDPSSPPREYGTTPWRLGVMAPGWKVNRWSAKGIVDEARLYDRALGAREIAALYEEYAWRPVFDGRSLQFMQPESQKGWKVEQGALVNAGQKGQAALTSEEFADGEIRIRFEAAKLAYLRFAVRKSADTAAVLELNRGQLVPLEGKLHELVFTCRGGDVAARLDGEPVPLSGRPASRGNVQFSALGELLLVRSLEFRELP